MCGFGHVGDAQARLRARILCMRVFFFFFQAEDGIRDLTVTGVQTCALPILAQRLVRAKAKIKAARIPYEVPGDDVLAERLDTVMGVVYLVFNEGYSASFGGSGGRRGGKEGRSRGAPYP